MESRIGMDLADETSHNAMIGPVIDILTEVVLRKKERKTKKCKYRYARLGSILLNIAFTDRGRYLVH